MKAEDIIIRALKRENKRLKLTSPNQYLSNGHLKKAEHNLIVMTDLNELRHEDWVVITAYYSMYHSALALLTKIGVESKEHATTVASLEYFFGEQINKELIEKLNKIKEKKDRIELIVIEEKYIDYMWKVKRARETVQYGIYINHKETDIIMNNARAFVTKIKLLINELDENLIEIVGKRVSELKMKQL